MNLDLMKNEIRTHLHKHVQVTVYGMRNKIDTYVGVINAMYPNIFTIKTDSGEKSFTYSDVITGEVKIKYLT
jgi:uncharacterized protein Veg